MNDTSQRGTFVALRDVLGAAAQHCLEAEAQLKVLAAQGSEPVIFAWDEIADKQHHLARLLIDFSSNGPTNLLETRFQYVPEEAMPSSTGTAEDAVAALVNFNYRLTENLRELSLDIAPPELGEMLDTLRLEVESVAQTISMISVTMQDH